MSTLFDIAAGVLRFFGAIVVGIFLLIILALFAGQVGLAGYLFPWGYLLILFLALRYAISGSASPVDRAAGAVAAGLTATGLYAISIVAGFALIVIMILSFIGVFAMMGTSTVAGTFGPLALIAMLVMVFATVAAAGLVYVSLQAGSSASVTPGKFGIAFLVAIIAAGLFVSSW
jgi:hypothetical protein